MKKLSLLLLTTFACLASTYVLAQVSTSTQSVAHFEKMVISPFIRVVLNKGDQEQVRLEYQGIEAEKINCVVKGRTLSVYLDGAKINGPRQRWNNHGRHYSESVYKDVQVTAYITYRELEYIQLRGVESLTCADSLVSDLFVLRVFGESKVKLAHLQTNVLKASFYGENTLTIASGSARRQRFRSYGENTVDTEKLKCVDLSASSFGENKFLVNASHQINIMAFGESSINYAGGAHFGKRLIIGESRINGQ